MTGKRIKNILTLLFTFHFSLFTFIFFPCFLQSQTGISAAQDTLKPKIDYRKLFDQAEEFLMNENYDEACPLYDTLLMQNKNNGNWNFKAGLCYINSPTRFSQSISFLERASANVSTDWEENSYKENKAPTIAYLYLADAYHRNNRFDEAIITYNKFKTFVSEKDKSYLGYLDYKIQICKNAKKLTANPVNLLIKNLGDSVNSPYADYSPVISADETMLLFTSRRPENMDGKTDDDGKYFENIYISYRSEDEMSWTKAKNIGAPINTAGHEATIGISIDGQMLFIYRDDADGGSIYFASMQGDNWTIPEKVAGDVNSKYWESHATLSADGNTLYFVSNRPGGYGGRDIYRCKKLPAGEWSKAMNLGPDINTPYEEESPFIQPGNNQLYFSSQGHESMGGFDIFTSNFIDTGIMGRWTEPENIGYPVNTTGDDLFFVPTVDNKRAYYSSFAAGSLGDKDIYMLTLPEKEESKLSVLRGTVSDDLGKIPPGTAIKVEDANNGNMVGNYFPGAKTGKYLLILSRGKTYKITYEAKGFHSVSNTYKVESGKEYLENEMIFFLKDVVLRKEIPGTVGVSGMVTDIRQKIISNAGIKAVDNVTGRPTGNYSSDSQGKFYLVLEHGKNYNLTFESEGYLFQSENINVPKAQVYSSIEKNVELQPIAPGSKNILKNLFFDSNISTIRKESFVELDNIYKLLTEKPRLKVEISGYTDNKGDDKFNATLSADRAKAVTDYLVKKGLAASRLTAKGYGKDRSIASNDTDAGRALNQRLEMKIVGK